MIRINYGDEWIKCCYFRMSGRRKNAIEEYTTLKHFKIVFFYRMFQRGDKIPSLMGALLERYFVLGGQGAENVAYMEFSADGFIKVLLDLQKYISGSKYMHKQDNCRQIIEMIDKLRQKAKGSGVENVEVFFWVPTTNPPTAYFCEHMKNGKIIDKCMFPEQEEHVKEAFLEPVGVDEFRAILDDMDKIAKSD